MSNIRILIVDDSTVFRSAIRAALDGVSGIEIVGTASNGKVALERLGQMSVDFVSLDLEMPEMTGVETLREMRKLGLNQKVVVFSSLSKRGAEITLDALSLGASDFITKPSSEDLTAGSALAPHERIRELLLPKIRDLFPELTASIPNQRSSTPSAYIKTDLEVFKPSVIVIGSSTGGPTALEKIFSSLKTSVRCPILITQHMPPLFTATLAERLGKISGIPAAEGKHGETIRSNQIYMAPGNFHMSLEATDKGIQIVLNQDEMVHSVRPAVDPLFLSASRIYQNKCFGIILTGMGEDGKIGAQKIKENRGGVMIQSQESCVVFGMPGAVFQADAYDKMGDLEAIVNTIRQVAAA